MFFEPELFSALSASLIPSTLRSTFDQSILKTATGAEERPVPSAREFNALQHAIKTLVGAARRGPNPVEALQFLIRSGLLETRGSDPHAFDREIQLRGGVLQRFLDGGKSRRLRIVVPENSNADGIAHLGYFSGEGRECGAWEVRRLVPRTRSRAATPQ